MEIQFQKQVYPCMQVWAEEIKNEEQTLEIRIPDAMPDIGSVLGAWGQILIRSKEWRGSGMSVTGGVMTWALYVPEDGSMPRTVEGWIPFSMRWDFPQAQRDGTILTSCMLRGVDVRCLSARKLMMRANVSIMARALEPSEFSVYQPTHIPEDVHLLRRSYPVCHLSEAGEKQFMLDEDLTLPSDMMGSKPMSFRIQPEITDKKLMADKVVFRGSALVQVLLRDGEGRLKTCSFDIPFSQYAQLDREYDDTSMVQILPLTTSMELDTLEDGRLRLKAGLTGQYVIYDRPMIELVEDAYSNHRSVKPKNGIAEVHAVLDLHSRTVSVTQSSSAALDEVIDVFLTMQQPIVQRGTEDLQILLSGGAAFLGRNEDGDILGTSAKWEEHFCMPADRNTNATVLSYPTGAARGILTSEGAELSSDITVEVLITSDKGSPQIIALELGELQEPDPARPTIVLCRAGDSELWQLAKQNGSTVEAIRSANHLEADPIPDQMLLIPVM